MITHFDIMILLSIVLGAQIAILILISQREDVK